jgi:gas vesicle protein
MSRNRSRWNHPVSALCIGLGVGAALGILFAPKPGEELREDIAGTVHDGIDAVRKNTHKVMRSARRFASDAKERINDAIEAGADVYRETLRS